MTENRFTKLLQNLKKLILKSCHH